MVNPTRRQFLGAIGLACVGLKVPVVKSASALGIGATPTYQINLKHGLEPSVLTFNPSTNIPCWGGHKDRCGLCGEIHDQCEHFHGAYRAGEKLAFERELRILKAVFGDDLHG